jgi:hypothetical protein
MKRHLLNVATAVGAARDASSSPPGDAAGGFFGLPTRGGWLALLNCAAWACLVLYAEERGGTLPGGAAMVAAVVFLSLPLALPLNVLLPSHSPQGVILWSIVLGLNSLAWGYGLSWLASRVFDARGARAAHRRRFGLCLRCGYDLRATPDQCPECGYRASEAR